MSNSSPSSGGAIQALVKLLIACIAPPAFLLSFAQSHHLTAWFTMVLVLLYEGLVLFVSFLTDVWQKLKQPWIEAVASKIDQAVRCTLSHYHRHYCRYFTYEHRDLDVKGITTQGFATLDLEDVFVELRIDPKAPHAASADPLRAPINLSQIPAQLRSGNHSIWEYLRLRGRHFVVLGPPGSGKTTMLKHIGLTLLHRRQVRIPRSLRHKIPVLLFLREHSKSITDRAEYLLADAVRKSAARWNYPMPAGWIEHRLVRGQCLILLDGLDEIADTTQRQQTVNWVERQMRNHDNNHFVLTSRPFGYRENPLPKVMLLEVQPFTLQQATEFVMSWYRANEIKSAVRDDPGVRMKAERGAQDLLRRLRETPDLFALVVNPLLLTMIATIHRYRGMLPGARVELYKEICEVFFGKRQAAHGVAQDLRAEQRQLVLQPLAYAMMQRGVRTIDSRQAQHLIAVPLQQVSTTLAPYDFLESVQNSSGLLLERERGVYSFAHKTFQEYLAAVHISKQGLAQILTARVQDAWWHETIRLYCAQDNATPIVEACLNASSTEALILALECEREALRLQAEVQRKVEKAIVQGIEGRNPERRRITAEALLERRMRQMYALNERTFIDTTLVTHAEYQLFLNELRQQGKYHQPDHWIDFTFPAGQGRYPVLGMRRSDALAFCAWLTERARGIWQYRLPNEKDLAQMDRTFWKNLPQDTGYWTEGEQRFTWSQEHPSPSISTRFQETFIGALDPALVHDFSLDLDLDLVRTLALTRFLDLALVRGRASDFDLDRALDRVLDRAPDRISTLDRARVRALDLVLAHALDRDLYIHIFLLKERMEQRLPAWEGILLVKERIVDA